MRVHLGSLLKVVVFLTITGLLITIIGLTFGRVRLNPSHDFKADFTDASGITNGSSVRAAGVVVGTVNSVAIRPEGGVVVEFSVDDTVPLTTTTQAQIRYADLTGSRYLELAPGTAVGSALPAGSIIPQNRTRPALDIDALLAGFDPLMQALNPAEVNQLTANLIAVTQGQAGSIQQLLTNVGSFTSGLSSRNELVGRVITDLSTTLGVVDHRHGDFDQMIVNLNDLVTKLSADRETLGTSIDSINTLALDGASLLRRIRPDFAANIAQIGTVAKTLDEQSNLLSETLSLLQPTMQRLGRGGAYGSFFNFFICSASVVVTIPGQAPYRSQRFTSPAARCKFPQDR